MLQLSKPVIIYSDITVGWWGLEPVDFVDNSADIYSLVLLIVSPANLYDRIIVELLLKS